MIRFGLFQAGDSFVHRLDARVKILCTVVLSLLIVQARSGEIISLTALLLAAAGLSQLRIRDVLRALRPIAVFALLLFFLHAFSTSGTIALAVPYLPLSVTREGIAQGLLVCWQFTALVTAGTLLTLTTSPSALVTALERLLHPLQRLGVPTQAIALMVSLALRFVPTILAELECLLTAQKARGADIATGSLRSRFEATTTLVLPLIVGTFRRADELADAMEARGYAGGVRTSMETFRFGRAEAAVLAVLLLQLLVSTAIRWGV